MRFPLRTLLATALLAGLAASPALAMGSLGWLGGDPGSGNGGSGGGGDPPGGTAVPGPIAGAGLGFLVLAGGYYAVRRWRKQNPGD